MTYKFLISTSLFLIVSCRVSAVNTQAPTHLTTEMLEHTDRVFLDGYPSNLSLTELGTAVERYQLADIRTANPHFGWVVESDRPNTVQTAYQILLASSAGLLEKDSADVWNSGKTVSNNSVAVNAGRPLPLQPSTVYHWKVKIWDSHGRESAFSAMKSFRTAAEFDDAVSVYPLQITDEKPSSNRILPNGNRLFDFGKDAFGKLKLTIFAEDENDTAVIHIGEMLNAWGEVERKPGGTIRYAEYRLPLLKGTHTYSLKIRPDKRNTGAAAVKMPGYTGEVLPFRYCEVENSSSFTVRELNRQAVHYPFDETAAYFHSSDTILNQIWEICHYSMKATSFCGVFVDGDRERIPYEADAFINQLGYYCTQRDYSIARRSHEYLIFNATWPTEWFLHSVLMAWYDYLYSGNSASLEKYYGELKHKTLISLKEQNGLISTTTGKQDEVLRQSVHTNSKISDIVDWPRAGGFGAKGEADGYVLTDYNTVVNSFHYEALHLMSKIAEALGNAADGQFYAKEAERVKKQINALLFDRKKGIYKDGLDTDHSALHANMLPAAFGVVPEKHRKTVANFIRSRGMACSVYGSQYLLDAVYNSGDAAYGLQLLTDTTDRSWYNMLRVGSTITLEAWDNKYKPNQDWNHAWGAAPANIIPRKLFGIEPLEAGFRKIRIQPQPATLRQAEILMPTVRGNVRVAFKNTPNEKFLLNVEIPANATAEIVLPNGETKEVGSGSHEFSVTLK
jgi:hypothetical protein